MILNTAAFKKPFFLFLILNAMLFFAGCNSVPDNYAFNNYEQTGISRKIYDRPARSEASLFYFFLSHNSEEKESSVIEMARLYIEEARAEGINSDIAFVQMCHETNFLRFGNLVTKDMNNFCGLGSTGPGQPGLSFKTRRLGVRAHIQHLHAYGTTEDVCLNRDLIDSRYKYVQPRGKSPDIRGLTRTWASDPNYSAKLEKYLCELEQF